MDHGYIGLVGPVSNDVLFPMIYSIIVSDSDRCSIRGPAAMSNVRIMETALEMMMTTTLEH